MKTAHFKYVEQRGAGTITIYGSVIVKYDGKISISLLQAKRYSAATRYQAKKLANEIVEAKFTHPAVISIVYMDSSLVGLLTDKTQDLKIRWIEKTREFVQNYWVYAVKELAKPAEVLYRENKVKTEVVKDWRGEQQVRLVYDKNYYKLKDKLHRLRGLIAGGKAEFEAKEIKLAEEHYKHCIFKLSDRLRAKGVEAGPELVITKGWVGVNLEMTFKYKDIYTKAWTIVAEGPIQRAHYRYLVK